MKRKDYGKRDSFKYTVTTDEIRHLFEESALNYILTTQKDKANDEIFLEDETTALATFLYQQLCIMIDHYDSSEIEIELSDDQIGEVIYCGLLAYEYDDDLDEMMCSYSDAEVWQLARNAVMMQRQICLELYEMSQGLIKA